VYFYIDYGDGKEPVCAHSFSIYRIQSFNNFNKEKMIDVEFIIDVEWVKEFGLKLKNYKMEPKTLTDLNEKEFNDLKDSGMLWEFFPNAPENYEQI